MEQYIEFIGNHMFLSAAFVAVLLLIIRAEVLHQTEKAIRMDPLAATRMMNSENPLLIDIRAESDFGNGHIKNAVNMPLLSFKDKISGISEDKDRPVLVYCNTGNTSIRACRMLRQSGFSNVHHISGGIAAWQEANLPVARQGSGKSTKQKRPQKSN